MKFLTEFLDQHALRWSFLYPISFVIGIASYLELSSEPNWVLVMSCILLSGLVRQIIKSRQSVLLAALINIVLCYLAGFSVAKIKTNWVAAPKIVEKIGPVSLEGRLDEIQGGRNGNRLKIEVGAITGIPKLDTPHFVRVTQKEDTELLPGRELKCLVFLSPPPKPQIQGDFNFARLAYFQKIGAVGFVLGKCKPQATSNLAEENFVQKAKTRIASIRREISIYILETLGEKSGGIASAIITGDRSFLKPEDQDALRTIGLAHLLAISGLHMGLAASVFYFLSRIMVTFIEPLALRVPVQKVAAVSALLGASTYLLLSGGSVATQRAYIMTVVALWAVILDRPAFSFRTLAVAFVIVAILQPETVLSPGFQMSFAATAALIAVYENWRLYRTANLASKLWNGFLTLAVTSVTASMATAPFAAYHFQQIAPLSIPANLLVMPIVSLWAAPSAAFALVFAPIGLQEPFLHSFGNALELILDLSRELQSLSPEIRDVSLPANNFILFITAVIAGIILKKYYKVIGLGLFAIAAYVSFDPITPILYSTNSGIYMKEEDSWMHVIHDNTESSNLVPMRLKGLIKGTKKLSADDKPMAINNEFYTADLSFVSCSIKGNSNLSIRLKKKAGEPDERCISINLGNPNEQLSVFLKSDGFKVTRSVPHKRPWTE